VQRRVGAVIDDPRAARLEEESEEDAGRDEDDERVRAISPKRKVQ
jgi:hypothetical protein